MERERYTDKVRLYDINIYIYIRKEYIEDKIWLDKIRDG